MDELLERQDDHDDRVVLKELALPTIIAQTQIRNTFRLAWPLHKDDTLLQSGRPSGRNIYFIWFPRV
ncbi:hypothetical protein M422DRAFT_191181 [Sphaerobolus stellatus SS14]|uniref:Uncharacterized protein n=1 Tax=Sphaerobolus stellatus (strain SS14) TaxID=990650 RepID=A0A0C9TDR6_SPHS4|nr:hypothetical protein M422DRAFT_191181 [Sphaerobolus stellatus SS14]